MPLKLVVSIEPLALNEPLAIGDKLQVRYKDQLLGTAVCESVWPGEDRQTAILGLSGFNETLLDQRKIEVDCILNSYSGLIIPKESLVKSQAEDAVYKVRKEKVELSAVEVLAIVMVRRLLTVWNRGYYYNHTGISIRGNVLEVRFQEVA